MGFNEALKVAGDFGLYQKLLCFVYLSAVITFISFNYWGQIFILFAPKHRCKLEDGTFNAFFDANLTANESELSFGENQQCQVQVFVKNSTEGISDSFNGTSGVWTNCPFGWEFDFSDLYPTAASENGWICDESWKIFFIHSMYWTGTIFGYILVGFFSDRYGRKKIMNVAVFLSLVSTAASTVMPSYPTFTLSRFISALTMSNTATIAYMIVVEYTGPKSRTIIMFTWSAAWTLSSAMFPWLAFLLRDWRWLLMTIFAPGLFVFVSGWWLPESASWLITRGKNAETANLLKKVASVNGKNIPLDEFLQILNEDSSTKPVSAKNERRETFLSSTWGLVRTPNMRKKTIILFLTWGMVSMCYNGNSMQTSNVGTNIFMTYTLTALVEIPCSVFYVFVLNRFGRRWPNSICLITGGLCGVATILVPKEHSLIILILAMIVRMTFAAGFDITIQLGAEIFPTVVRGRGLSLQRTIGGIGSSFAPYIVSLAQYDRLLPLVVFGMLAVTAGILVLFLPETAKRHLPHTLEEGEQFGKDQKFCSCTGSTQEEEDMQNPEVQKEVEIATSAA